MTLLENALDCARRGWAVFRLKVTHNEAVCDGGTTSCKTFKVIGGSWPKVSTCDPEAIRSWDWSKANAYGIDCGKSGLVVADQDPGATWPFNGTRVHATGRGLHHIYSDLIGLRDRVSLAPWSVDIRGVGGMVVGPGSYHPHGEYTVELDLEPAPVPPELIAAMKQKPEPRPTEPDAGPLDPLECLQRLAGVYHRMEATPAGQRNDMLNKLAGIAAGLWVRLDPDDQIGSLSAGAIKEQLLQSIPFDGDPAKSTGTIESGWNHGLDHPAPDNDPDAPAAASVFDATPTLAKIRAAAHSRGMPASGVLANVLSTMLLYIDPEVLLPPVVGSTASLNLGFALVGESGASKSSSAAVAHEVLGKPDISVDWIKPLGTGEGLIDMFYRTVPKDPDKPDGAQRLELAEPWDRRVRVMADEGETIAKLSARTGSTIGEHLRTSLTGGMLGAANRKTGASGDRTVPEKTYRLTLVINVHPRRADVLLNEENTGLPQRFLWLSLAAGDLPENVDDLPDWPGAIDWYPPDITPGDVVYPADLAREVKQLNLDVKHGKRSARDGHMVLTRLKVAFALAVLHGETEITWQWWNLAGLLSDASGKLQDWCLSIMGEEYQAARNRDAKMSSRAADAAFDDRLDRAVEATLHRLSKTTGQVSWREIKPASRLLRDLDTKDIIDALEETGEVDIEPYDAQGRVAYRLTYQGENE